MPKPSDYKAIEFWGRRLGRFDYVIQAQQNLAAHQNAPLDAIYYSGDSGVWRTLRDVSNEDAIRAAVLQGLMPEPAKTKIRRHRVEVTVLYDSEICDPSGMSLEEISREIDTGSAMGHVCSLSDEALDEQQLRLACQAMGGDPSFFGVEDQ